MNKNEKAHAPRTTEVSAPFDVFAKIRKWEQCYAKLFRNTCDKHWGTEDVERLTEHWVKTHPVVIRHLRGDRNDAQCNTDDASHYPQGIWRVSTHDNVHFIMDARSDDHMVSALQAAAINAISSESIKMTFGMVRHITDLWKPDSNLDERAGEQRAEAADAICFRAVKTNNGHIKWEVEFAGSLDGVHSRKMRLCLQDLNNPAMKILCLKADAPMDANKKSVWTEPPSCDDEYLDIDLLLHFKLTSDTGESPPRLQAVLLKPDWTPAHLPETSVSIPLKEAHVNALHFAASANQHFAAMSKPSRDIEQTNEKSQKRHLVANVPYFSMTGLYNGLLNTYSFYEGQNRFSRVDEITFINEMWKSMPSNLIDSRMTQDDWVSLLSDICTREFKTPKGVDRSRERDWLINQVAGGMRRHVHLRALHESKAQRTCVVMRLLLENGGCYDKAAFCQGLTRSIPEMDAFFDEGLTFINANWPHELTGDSSYQPLMAPQRAVAAALYAFLAEAICLKSVF